MDRCVCSCGLWSCGGSCSVCIVGKYVCACRCLSVCVRVHVCFVHYMCTCPCDCIPTVMLHVINSMLLEPSQ